MTRSTSSSEPAGPWRPDAAQPPEDPEAAGPPEDPEAVGRRILLDQLTGRARSRAELAQRLARRRVPEEVATRLLDRFEEVGLVDDAAFARDWVESRRASRGLARRALAAELRRKGVAAPDVDAALAPIAPEDELDAAREVAQARLRRLRGCDRPTARRRLAGALARKGFPPGVVGAVVRETLAGWGDEDEAEVTDEGDY